MINAQQATAIRRTPEAQRSDEQKQLLKEYDDFTNRIAAEAAERRKREAEARQRAEREANECSLEWFSRQLSAELANRPQYITLARFADRIEPMVEQTYAQQVALRGGKLEKNELTTLVIGSVAKWLVKRPKTGLLLRGNVGLGKTIALLSIAKIWQLAAKQPLKIYTANELASIALNDTDKFRKIKACPALGIDDFGQEPKTVKSYGNDSSPLVELLTERYDRQLMTVITTNLTGEDVANYYGERIADRLREMCNTIDFGGNYKSFRK